MTASARRTQPGGGEGAGGGQRGQGRKFPEVVDLFRSPAGDPGGSPRLLCPGEVGVGVLREGGAQSPRAAFPPDLGLPLAFPARCGARTWTEEAEEGLGSPALPLPDGYSSGPEPRRQSPRPQPRGTDPTRIIKQCGSPPARKKAGHHVGAADLDSAGPAPDPRGRSPRYGGPPPRGVGEGARGGGREGAGAPWPHGGFLDPGLAWAEPSPESFRTLSPSLGALFRGVGRSFRDLWLPNEGRGVGSVLEDVAPGG